MNTIASSSRKHRLSKVKENYLATDVHSKLNSVIHSQAFQPQSKEEVVEFVKYARDHDLKVAIAGGRHSMGGQQFLANGLLLDMSAMNKIVSYDQQKGMVKVEAGILWDRLINEMALMNQSRTDLGWSIRQKPTGADHLSIGGCLSSNVHGRGLTYKPFVQDIEEFELVDSQGVLKTVDRSSPLFRLAVGGYGLFGVVVSVTLRLRKRQIMKRHVQEVAIENLCEEFQKLIDAGHQYGDCQFAIDNKNDNFLRSGILASYKPVHDDEAPKKVENRVLSLSQWLELLELAHFDKSAAFQTYLTHYRATHGQVYYSDTMQLSTYIKDYHEELEKKVGSCRATEIITELYVPRARLHDFMEAVRILFRKNEVDLVYGTIRLIEKDDQTFLAWAKDDYACVIFNLHTEHSMEGISKSANVFRSLINIADSMNGSFFLTYHRFVEREALDRCYPQFEQFLKLKQSHDPAEIFQSQWYRHYRQMYNLEDCQANST